VRQVEAEVAIAFPGTWRWRTALLVPDHFALTVYTTREADHYVYDGRATYAFVGQRQVAIDPRVDSPLRSLARFTAVVGLDALRLPRARLGAAAGAGPAAAAAGAAVEVEVALLDDGARYRLGFDGRERLVWASGPLALDPFGEGEVTARFDDFRPAAGRLLAHRAEYLFRGRPLARERTLSACLAAGLAPAAFAVPWTLPECDPLK
jgi:hypothetical protein